MRRDIGKVLGYEDNELSRLAGLVRTFEWKDPTETPERNFREAGFELRDPRVRKFLELYVAVQDLLETPRTTFRRHGDLSGTTGQRRTSGTLQPCLAGRSFSGTRTIAPIWVS